MKLGNGNITSRQGHEAARLSKANGHQLVALSQWPYPGHNGMSKKPHCDSPEYVFVSQSKTLFSVATTVLFASCSFVCPDNQPLVLSCFYPAA